MMHEKSDNTYKGLAGCHQPDRNHLWDQGSPLTRWRAIYRPDVKIGRFLSVLVCSGIAFGMYRGIQENYLAEIVHISAFERGIVEFFRETPGLLVVLMLAALYRFNECRIFKISVAVMAAGLIALLLSGSGKATVVLCMVLFSIGDHLIMPVRTTLSLDLAKKEQAGASLGITSALGQLGNILGFLLVTAVFFVFSKLGFARFDVVPFKAVFALAAALGIGASLVAFALRESPIPVRRQRFYFAKKFSKYYMLEVFYGARKQIFWTFGPYVLILQYGADTAIISLLMAVCAVFGALLSPLMGRIIDKAGYKAVMVTDTLLLIVVCFFYGFAHRLFPWRIAFIVVCVNYVLDAVISLASMASNVYVKDLSSSQEEATAALSTGVSVNHVISIFIALTGGFIWKLTGIEVLFSISAFLGILNSLYAATIRIPKPVRHET
jgi:MFS family permease